MIRAFAIIIAAFFASAGVELAWTMDNAAKVEAGQ